MQKEMCCFPDFEKPPLVEVVCGVLFDDVKELLVPHFGQLWERFKPEYVACQERPPIAPVFENNASELTIEFSNIPPLPRIWFVRQDGNGIIQVQRDRFLYNWRQTRPSDEYPRYHTVINSFNAHFSKFQEFITSTALGEVRPLQYEMTYVNHVPFGKDGVNRGIGRILPDCAWRALPERFLPEIEGFIWNPVFRLPDENGRLHVKAQVVIRANDNMPILLLEITARGIGTDRSIEGMQAWFDLAREWIVRGFADLTGSDIQDEWGRKA